MVVLRVASDLSGARDIAKRPPKLGRVGTTQATCRSGTSTFPLVSGLMSNAQAKLSAPTQVPTIIGMANPKSYWTAKKVSTNGTKPPQIAPW